MFDIIFMIDRIMDLFVGYYTSKGPEKKLMAVLLNNISAKFFTEMVISFGPLFFDVANMNTLIYCLFKIPRYSRLFEVENQINEIIDYYASSLTVFEINRMKKKLNIMQFILSTFINLHILTCTQIILCSHRDFDNSWMANVSHYEVNSF
jgi:hypothetical protein